VVNSGAKSERYVKALYPTLPRQAFVEYGNYIGETLKMARELGFSRVTLGVMLGKAVKLAEGQLDTHSKKGTMNKDFICQMLDEASCQADLTDMTLARELWQRIEKGKIEAFCRVVIRHCLEHCQPLVPQAQLTLLLIDDDGTIHSL
jgi:cobalt-precorrin-5B (C1)-methyltransferase